MTHPFDQIVLNSPQPQPKPQPQPQPRPITTLALGEEGGGKPR